VRAVRTVAANGILIGAGVVIDRPVAWVILLLCAAVFIAVSLLDWRRKRETGNPELEAELTAIIDQGHKLDRGPFFETHYRSYKFWIDRTAAFLFAVLGPEVRDDFNAAGGLQERVLWLRRCREQPPKVRGDIGAAAAVRKGLTDADRIVLAGGPLDG
jgi:hypothetical protein